MRISLTQLSQAHNSNLLFPIIYYLLPLIMHTKHPPAITGTVTEQLHAVISACHNAAVVEIIRPLAVITLEPKPAVGPLQGVFRVGIIVLKAVGTLQIECVKLLVERGIAYHQAVACAKDAGTAQLGSRRYRNVVRRLAVLQLHLQVQDIILRLLSHHAEHA